MFRISYNRAISDAWRSRMLELPEPKKRRMYRWGSHWLSIEDKIVCEKRIPHSTSDSMIVEVIEPASCTILPKEIDDLWEEDFIVFPNGIEYNGLVFLKGGKEVLEIAESQGLPLPSLPPLSSLPSLPNAPKPISPSTSGPAKQNHVVKKSRVCMIRD